MALEINDSNFDELVSNSEKPVLLDFWAEWCGPCRMIAPIIEELHNQYGDKVVIGKVDVDDSAKVSEKFGIRSIPTLVFMKNGEMVDKLVGAVPKNTIEEKLKSIL